MFSYFLIRSYAVKFEFTRAQAHKQNRSTAFLALYLPYFPQTIRQNGLSWLIKFVYENNSVAEGMQLSSKIIFKGLTENLSMPIKILIMLMSIKFAYCKSMFCYRCAMFCNIFQYDNVGKDGIGEACSTYGQDQKYDQYFSRGRSSLRWPICRSDDNIKMDVK